MRKNKLKEILYNKQVAIGQFLKITDPAVVEIAGNAGFDFVIIDNEHGPIDIQNIQNMIRAAEVADITPVVRVRDNDETLILKVLDIGAQAIEVPQINNINQADALIKAVKYSPKGERGLCRYVRSAGYSKLTETNEQKKEYFKNANNETLIIAHIEGLEGIRNIDTIMSRGEIDVLFIGPYDLSQSLGIPGEINDPKVEEQMKIIIEKAKRNNKIIGTFVDDLDTAHKWINAGVQYIAFSVDVGLLYAKYREIIGNLK